MDAPFWALKLKYPTSVEACVSTYYIDVFKPCKEENEQYPRSSIIRYTFPAREGMPEVDLTWWDGGMLPPRPKLLEAGRRMDDDGSGVLFIGDRGVLLSGTYGNSPRLIPESRMRAYKQPPRVLPRVPGGSSGHEQNWISACKTGKPAVSNFDDAGPLTEMVLLGNQAVRFPNRKLLWDGDKMQVTNDAQANAYVRRHYREGWTLGAG
jgi:hypothetical protein